MRASWSWLYFFFTIFIISGNFSVVKPTAGVIKSSRLSTGFLFQRTVSINQKTCSCSTAFSCVCCQSVRILLRSVTTNLCVNFRYAQTGLSMNISLGSKVIRHVSIIDYRAFKVCTSIPDSPHSFACVDVVELSLFPRSITICLQLDIKSKTDNWMINYNCISISTILSSQSNNSVPTTTVQSSTTNIVLNGSTGTNGTPSMGMPGNGQMSPMGMPGNGQMPPGLIPAMFNAGGRTSVFKSTGRVPGFLDRISSKKSRELRSVVRMVQNGLKFGGLKRDRDRRGIKNPVINQNCPKLLQEEGRVFEERKVEMEIKFRGRFPTDKLIPKNLPIGLNHRVKRDFRDRSDSSAMKMQVILRSRKNRLPRIMGNEMAKGFKTLANFPASRSPRIVNGGTVPIPNSGLGLGNVQILNATSSKNGFNPASSESQMEFPPSQPLPVQPSNGAPVFVLQNPPPIERPIPLDFSMYYDNRTSSFPNRTPPGFGLVSRIGPIDQKNVSIAFERSVEELETVGPKIQLHPNSKIVEISATDLSDGRIIFPE